MNSLWTLVDSAVADVVSAHPDYFTPKGQEGARRHIVRKVTSALRDAMSAPKPKTEDGEAQPQPGEPVIPQVECWSREWWAVLLRKIEHKQSTGWMLQYARAAQRGQMFVLAGEDMPGEAEVAALATYPSNGPEMERWRLWFERHGVRLPEWRERVWVFLPGSDPPNSA